MSEDQHYFYIYYNLSLKKSHYVPPYILGKFYNLEKMVCLFVENLANLVLKKH